MKEISVNGHPLMVKDTHCAPCGDGFQLCPDATYPVKEQTTLWLYVHVTNRCPAGCPFCASPPAGAPALADPARYEQALRLCRDRIAGVSFTGGEPMLEPELVEALIAVTDRYLPRETELDLVTNGTNPDRLAGLKGLSRLTTIHISRHAAEDAQNRRLMRFPGAPDAEALRACISTLPDPDAVVLNCVLQTGGTDRFEAVAAYLDLAISLRVRNCGFFTMFPANGYCKTHFCSPLAFPVVSDDALAAWNRAHAEQFAVWNRMRDHDFCRCLSGDYQNRDGRTRFYFRCPGPESAPKLCRQLVYTAQNHLQDGFGPDRTILF